MNAIETARMALYQAAADMNATPVGAADYGAKVAAWREAGGVLAALSPKLPEAPSAPQRVRRTVLGAVYVRGGR